MIMPHHAAVVGSDASLFLLFWVRRDVALTWCMLCKAADCRRYVCAAKSAF